jgi:feruloyl esterase
MKIATTGLIALGLASAGLSAEAASGKSVAPEAGNCAALAGVKLDKVEIVSAGVQAANETVPGAFMPDYTGLGKGPPIRGLPAFCRVVARAHPEPGSDIRFEVWLPASGWNGRFFGVGNGGFAGSISYMELSAALRSGYATASTDTGHEAFGMDSKWARGNPQKIRDYGWRGVHVMTANAKALTAAFYGSKAEKNYFASCSNGGRQGLMEAARYPGDYDGIVAGAPAMPFTRLIMAMAWTQQVQAPAGAAIRPSQVKLLQQEVVQQCDALDGLADGILDDPRQCKFDTAKLACGTSSSDQCFAPEQVGALDRLLAGPHNSRGAQVAPAYPLSGAEAGRPVPNLGWEGWIAAGGSQPPANAQFPHGILQDLVAKPFADTQTFDWDRHPARLAATAGRDLDVSPNLSRFFARGGKLIVWHGWADVAIPPQLAIDYYTAMLGKSGPKAKDSVRLFMIPGMQHCFGGNGAVNFGQFLPPSPGEAPQSNINVAMQHWVEQGRVPESLIGRIGLNPVAAASPADKQRLHCPFPQRARLTPGQDPDKAASYTCR